MKTCLELKGFSSNRFDKIMASVPMWIYLSFQTLFVEWREMVIGSMALSRRLLKAVVACSL